MRRIWRASLLIGFAAVTSSSALLADVTGSILGTVTDPSSAVIQGVRVTATNIDTNLVGETTTDAGLKRLYVRVGYARIAQQHRSVSHNTKGGLLLVPIL